MKYKGLNENTIRHMLQSNETALLQKAVTEMVGTITSSADSLLSSFSIEKFFTNKNFSDLSDFVKNILDNVKDISEKAYNANINTNSLEKSISDFMKDIKINTAKTSESVNKIANNKPADLSKDIENLNKSMNLIYNPVEDLSDIIDVLNTGLSEYSKNLLNTVKRTSENIIAPVNDFIKTSVLKGHLENAVNENKETGNTQAFFKGVIESIKDSMKTGIESLSKKSSEMITDRIIDFNNLADKVFDSKNYDSNITKITKSTAGFLKSIMSGTMRIVHKLRDDKTKENVDYTSEQRADEERSRSEKQSGMLEKTTDFLLSTLAPWIKEFDPKNPLNPSGFLMTFFPLLGSFINASPLLLKILNWGKLILGIGGAIFGIWKFVEGIGKAVDVLGHEIDFTTLNGWLEALNLGLGNIVSSITGIDLKTVYNWLNSFDRTMYGVYKRFLKPIIDSLWKSIKQGLTMMYDNWIRPVFESLSNYFGEFAEKFPVISNAMEGIWKFLDEDLRPWITEKFSNIFSGISNSIKSVSSILGSNSKDSKLKDFFEYIQSPIETISTSLTEIMKYIGTIYTMFSEMTSWKDLFDPDKWAKSYEKVSESSLYTGNKYSDEIYELMEKNRQYQDTIGELSMKRKKYDDMTLKGFGISAEDYGENAKIKPLEKIMESLTRKEDKEALKRILEGKDLRDDISISQRMNRDKQILEEFRDKQMSLYETDISSYRKRMDENKKLIEQYTKMNEQEKFIGVQIRQGKTKEEAEKLWNRMESRKNPSIESVKDEKGIESETVMSSQAQAQTNAEMVKPSTNTNVNNSGNTSYNQQINNYNSTSRESDIDLKSTKIVGESL